MGPPRKYATCLVTAFLLASLATWVALGSRPQAASAENTACSVEQVALPAPGGVLLSGILYHPKAKSRPTVILLVHGFGGNFYNEYFPLLGQHAAEQGYASLALNMRDHDAGPKVSDFADNEADIATGVAYLRKLGYSKLVLLGQSMGTNRVLYYQAVTGDPGIVATVLVSGPGNLFEWNVWQFGRRIAQATVDEALKMQAAGQENQLMVVDLGPLGKALYTPHYLLSMRGPNARSDPYQNIQKVTTPILIIQGKADKLIAPDIGERLRQAAPRSTKVDSIYLEGADHTFKKQEAVLVERILAWLKQVAP
jgi:pimeloyl-ACP methyl ester carboxylesterase